MHKLIRKSDWILTGTSWASNLEKEAVKLATAHKKKVVSFLDHWTNYLQRFESNGQILLPDEIWVGDEDALKIAQSCFPQEKLRLVPNPYFRDIKDELKITKTPTKMTEKTRILYVSEPIEEHSKEKYGHSLHWGYTEYDAMRFFFTSLPDIFTLEQVEFVLVRKHPSESKNKYESLLEEYPAISFQISDGSSLVADCVWADCIVGCESMALVVGLLAKKKVYSCIPHGGEKCSLPHQEIIRI